jgi:hypothetical protein
MAYYDSADLLAELKRVTLTGTNTLDTTTAQYYRLLQNAQVRIARLLATHVPHINRTVEELGTADSGYTYTFDYAPLGHAELRDGRNGALLLPASDWDPNGYVIEGQTVRMPNGRARIFANGLWARYCKTPGALDASNEPSLLPADIRMAIVYDAAVEWASQGGAADKTPYEDMKRDFLWGNPRVFGDLGVIPAMKAQYFGQGASAQHSDYWWRGQGWR